MAAGVQKPFWFAGFLLSDIIPSAEARLSEQSSKPNNKLLTSLGVLLTADTVLCTDFQKRIFKRIILLLLPSVVKLLGDLRQLTG